MLSTAAFIIGMIIVGLCLVVGALILSGAINGAAAALKESAPQSLQQPTLTFLTEYDAADYLGISLNELDYIRSEGLLDGAFIAVTSLEQTGEEEYADYEDGVEVTKVRPVMSNVTRFLFNRQLLDEKMMEAIRNGSHINPFRSKNQDKKQGGKKSGKHSNGGDNAQAPRKEGNKRPVVQIFPEPDEDETESEAPAVEKEPENAAPAAEEKTTPENSKPAAAGPPKPMGPIGDDEPGADDVIDIMARINSGKQGGGRPDSGKPNGNRNGNGGSHNRSNGNRSGNGGSNRGNSGSSHNRGNGGGNGSRPNN